MTAAEAFWQFSLRFYAYPRVRELCLRLQDEDGLNVNILLWCCWHGLNGRALGSEDMAQAAARTEAWSRTVTQSLRAGRRQVKAAACGEADGQAAGQLYETLKAAELEAERVEQALLCVVPFPGTERAGHNLADLVKSNLGAYMEATNARGTERASLAKNTAELVRLAAAFGGC